MSAKRIDRTGLRFGSWTVIAFDKSYGSCDAKWICRCDCGAERSVIFRSLASGRSTSCGCTAVKKRVQALTKHGMAGDSTYKSWHAMLQRVEGKGGHESYVERGITVCDRWRVFENFLADMGVRPAGKTLDRIDNHAGYSPENCRWATPTQQMNNRSTSRKEIVRDYLMSPTEAARAFGVHISGVRHRLRKGWTLEDAVTIPMATRSKQHE